MEIDCSDAGHAQQRLLDDANVVNTEKEIGSSGTDGIQCRGAVDICSFDETQLHFPTECGEESCQYIKLRIRDDQRNDNAGAQHQLQTGYCELTIPYDDDSLAHCNLLPVPLHVEIQTVVAVNALFLMFPMCRALHSQRQQLVP